MNNYKYNFIACNYYGNEAPLTEPEESYEFFLNRYGEKNPFTGEMQLWTCEPEEITEYDIACFYTEYEKRKGVKL